MDLLERAIHHSIPGDGASPLEGTRFKPQELHTLLRLLFGGAFEHVATELAVGRYN